MGATQPLPAPFWQSFTQAVATASQRNPVWTLVILALIVVVVFSLALVLNYKLRIRRIEADERLAVLKALKTDDLPRHIGVVAARRLVVRVFGGDR